MCKWHKLCITTKFPFILTLFTGDPLKKDSAREYAGWVSVKLIEPGHFKGRHLD